MPIVMSVGPWATSPHARTRAEPNRAGPGAGGARPRPADTNAVCWASYILLVFYFLFLFKNSVEIFRVELDPFKRIGSARCNHSRMITDSLGLLQTERSAEGYKYPISARIFYMKQKLIYPLSPTNFLYKKLCSCYRNLVLSQRYFFTYGQQTSV